MPIFQRYTLWSTHFRNHVNRAGDSRFILSPFFPPRDSRVSMIPWPPLGNVIPPVLSRVLYTSRHYRNAFPQVVAFGVNDWRRCAYTIFVSVISRISRRYLARIQSRMATSIDIDSLINFRRFHRIFRKYILRDILEIILQFIVDWFLIELQIFFFSLFLTGKKKDMYKSQLVLNGVAAISALTAYTILMRISLFYAMCHFYKAPCIKENIYYLEITMVI